ncbi:unnamed protein product, partial [Owenia fusiformis]
MNFVNNTNAALLSEKPYRMYAEWTSLQNAIQSDTGNKSVLHTSFPSSVGKDVAVVVVRSLAQNLSLSTENGDVSGLKTDKEVKWTMEVICFGLSLPLQEHEAIKDCVNVYCEWISAQTMAKTCVPLPVLEDPNAYTQTMLHHLFNLFVPRSDAGFDLVKRQTILCHRVLRTVQVLAKDSYTLSSDTWETLLKFLLSICDILLAPPTVKEGIGDLLCERVLGVLFEIWLLACAKCFPGPSLWKTFRDMCSYWRHHEALVIQWHKTNVALTAKLLKFMYGEDYPELQIAEEDPVIVPPEMSNDAIAQTWFRFLHTLSNPVDLCQAEVISQTPKFLHMALSSENVIDPSQHECLKNLPQIFYKAMRSISVLVDAYLGISQALEDADVCAVAALAPPLIAPAPSSSRHSTPVGSTPGTPPGHRKKVFSMASGSTKQKGHTKQSTNTAITPSNTIVGQVTLNSRPPLASNRPKCNSVLHLFGAWLCEAALAGVKFKGSHSTSVPPSRRTSFLEEQAKRRSMPDPSEVASVEKQSNVYEAGRAEAGGALCRIFCAHKTGEDILPVYLSRFYIAMFYGLQIDESISGQVLSNLLFNSSDLLRIDLDGVHVLVPQILSALELVLMDLKPVFRPHEQIPQVELRKASIHLLISMLCLPLHFKSLQIKDIVPPSELRDQPTTFLSLKMRMIELLLRALTIETDSMNTQMLLGGLMLCVQDLAMCEEVEQTMVQQTTDACPETIPESGSDHGSHSDSRSIDSGEQVPRMHAHPAHQEYDTSHGLFGHAASLVCNRLMATWKQDLNIALAAMEVLSGLAKVQLNIPNMLMCKRTVKWICDFIVYQCSRPAPAHTRDLHSMIVAAFNCLTLWLVQHPYLMQDKECLHCVLEVVELGISGSKSQNRASDPPKLKAEKPLMPASMRVKDAAEGVLTSIIDQVGSFPPPCGPESLCSLLDEESLLKYCNGGPPEHTLKFRYFVLDNSIVVGLLEQPLGNDQDPLPTVTAIIRGPFGRHAWTMQLRHLPRLRKVGSKSGLSEHGRPAPMDNVGVHHNIKHKNFPDIVNTIPHTQADESIPSLQDIVSEKEAQELDKIKSFIEAQSNFEKKVQDKISKERSQAPYPDPVTECKAPSVCHEFQTARLFLSHYGFLSLESLKEPSNSSQPPSLVQLDSSHATFMSAIDSLDNIPVRTSDTVFLFYVKSGQSTAEQILENVMNQNKVHPHYLEFLRSLGWPVEVDQHAGWTGNTANSWKSTQSQSHTDAPVEHGGCLYDGQRQVLYWADVASECAFIVPSTETYAISTRSQQNG